MSGHTCGLACWAAQDDVCHCSCGGVNHGCLRGEFGVAPARSRKIAGVFYELHAVCDGYGEVITARETDRQFFSTHTTLTKTATAKEIAAWPELQAYRGKSELDRILKPVVLIWKRTDKYK